MSQINTNMQKPITPTEVPNFSSQELAALLQKTFNVELPEVPANQKGTSTLPALAAGSALSLEVLMDAIGESIRTSETNAGIASIKSNAQSRELANKEKLAKIDEQIKKLEEAGVWGKIGKAFAWIGAIIGVAVSAALVATGAGAAAGVGLALACVALVSQVADTIGEANGGKGYGLTSLIAQGLGKVFGEKAEGWIKMALDLILTIATIATSFGASAAAKAGDAVKLVTLMQKVGQASQSIAGIASAGANIGASVNTYQAQMAQADQKKFEAILEQIAMMNTLINDHMKHVIEESQNIASAVKDIVQDNAQTQTMILTENPSLA